MSTAPPGVSKFDFFRTFVLPALLVFLVPVLAWLLFWSAESHLDAVLRGEVLAAIDADNSLSAQDRAAATNLFSSRPFSALVTDPQFTAMVSPEAQFQYAVFRWMLRLSWFSIAAGITVFALAGIAVLFSLRSPRAQYISLAASWHVLRSFVIMQAIVQGILLTALSFWATAFFFDAYYPKIVLLAGLGSLAVVAAVVKAIFRSPQPMPAVEGALLPRARAASLWGKLEQLCARVGTSPPDQIVAGIDDNFFVTEMPLTVRDQTVVGKTLFVSLPLLKQMRSEEAAAVLAHEMAHFSGADTLYSRKISPLLQRYGHYLEALHEGVGRPIYYFMACFRALFELSLGKISRERELRADRIAAETVSAHDAASALLRTASYSLFRAQVEQELFADDQARDVVGVADRLETGFEGFAASFASRQGIGSLESSHPFDSHPPLAQRWSALGVPADAANFQALLAVPADGGWYHDIDDAPALERDLWQAYEARFRDLHRDSLAYRYLPATPEECAVVEETFPPLTFESKRGRLAIDCLSMSAGDWPDPVEFREIVACRMNDGVLSIDIDRNGKQTRKVKTGHFKPNNHALIQEFQRYYGRYLTAVDYRTRVAAAPDDESEQQ